MPQSLHSLLLARKELNNDYGLLKSLDQSLDSAKPYEPNSDGRRYNNYSIHEQYEQPFDEKEAELLGNSVMMYADLSEPALDCQKILSESLITSLNRFDQTEIELSDKICAHSASLINSSNNSCDLLSIRLENESLKSSLHQIRQAESLCQEEKMCLNLEIGSLRQQINHTHQQSAAAAEELISFRALCSDLQLKVVELENYRMTQKIGKSEHDAYLQRLSSENGHLKAAQRDISAFSVSAEKKMAALESSKLALTEQVSELERQLSESTMKAKKTLDSLFAAQRQLTQLDAENILLRQLRVDLDSSSKDCTLLRRQVVTLEAELTKYRSNSTQIQASMTRNGGQVWDAHLNPQSSRQSMQPLTDSASRRADPVRLEGPDERDWGPRLSGHAAPSLFQRDVTGYQQEQQMVGMRSSSGAPLSSFVSPAVHLQRKASSQRGEGDSDASWLLPSSGDTSLTEFDIDTRKAPAMHPVQQSLSLADIIGGRRGNTTTTHDPSQRTSLSALIAPLARSSSSSNREDELCRIEGSGSDVHHIHTMTVPALHASRRSTLHESGNYRGSGGGVSSFYDDLEPSAGAPIAPFGTSQSVLSSMAVYEETDRHLTALMTEKASLNEESSRLQQRGGKVLRERTRLQHIDARVEEIGKEIAHERKKLSGKPG